MNIDNDISIILTEIIFPFYIFHFSINIVLLIFIQWIFSNFHTYVPFIDTPNLLVENMNEKYEWNARYTEHWMISVNIMDISLSIFIYHYSDTQLILTQYIFHIQWCIPKS